jgi:hypothetical protein
MIKPGKVFSQPMKANYTGETDINVVRKYFRLTFVFNGLKHFSKFMLELLHGSEKCFKFRIRGVLNLKHT